jgi:hypothetical protein
MFRRQNGMILQEAIHAEWKIAQINQATQPLSIALFLRISLSHSCWFFFSLTKKSTNQFKTATFDWEIRREDILKHLRLKCTPIDENRS